MARPAPTETRFKAKFIVDPLTDCWLWQANTDKAGYGLFIDKGKTYQAHRMSWLLSGQELIEGLTLDHLCRERSCVNPSHLEQITSVENVMRGKGIPALNMLKTHCKNGHEFTESNTYLRISSNGKSGRSCRTCSIKKATARYYKNRGHTV
jgi:hypothetical protein